ncbi:MAG: alpha/beta fold hydrolase [Isosphaeraceae bacterium]
MSVLRRFRNRRRIVRVAALAGMALACWLVGSLAATYRLTHRKAATYPEPPPEVAWGPLESHRIATADGQQIGAWYAEGLGKGPSVLLLHGNGGSRQSSLGRASMLAGEGCSVLMITLRAHGDSTGDFHDIGYSARHDVVAAVEFLRRRRPDRPLIVQGVSLGAAAALFAAGELGDSVAGYILESPYSDLKTATWNRTNAYLPPIVDRAAYLGLRMTAPLLLPDFEAIAPIRGIDRIPASVPILILAGDADRLARPEEARAFFERARSHARLEWFEGAGHVDLAHNDPGRYRELVLNFCARVARAE